MSCPFWADLLLVSKRQKYKGNTYMKKQILIARFGLVFTLSFGMVMSCAQLYAAEDNVENEASTENLVEFESPPETKNPTEFSYSDKPGLVDFFFPTLRKYEGDPSKTMIAPFAYEQVEGENGGEVIIPEYIPPTPDNTVPLHKQHRFNEDMIKWLGEKVPDLVNFQKGKYQEQMVVVQPLFTEEGWQDYLRFHKQFGFYKVLMTGDYATGGFVETLPYVVSQGVEKGRYQWEMSLPITVSFLKGNLTDYKEIQSHNQKLNLTVLLERSEEAPAPGVLVKTWSAVPVRQEE